MRKNRKNRVILMVRYTPITHGWVNSAAASEVGSTYATLLFHKRLLEHGTPVVLILEGRLAGRQARGRRGSGPFRG